MRELQADHSATRDEALVDGVPFGRSRALALFGAALFSLTLRVLAPDVARANHYGANPCYGFNQCHNCSGTTCYTSGGAQCQPCTTCGCPTQTQCWYTCSCGSDIRCCDWYDQGAGYYCICRAAVKSCGIGC